MVLGKRSFIQMKAEPLAFSQVRKLSQRRSVLPYPKIYLADYIIDQMWKFYDSILIVIIITTFPGMLNVLL